MILARKIIIPVVVFSAVIIIAYFVSALEVFPEIAWTLYYENQSKAKGEPSSISKTLPPSEEFWEEFWGHNQIKHSPM